MPAVIRRALSIVGAVAAVGAAAFAYGSLIERNAYVLRRVSVPVLPAGSRPIRVLHLSDLHMAPWQKRKQDWIRQLADLHPDLIVDTGDNLGHERGLEGIKRAFEPFAGIPGVYVWGSNDYFGPQAKNPFRYFRKSTHSKSSGALLDRPGLQTYLDSLGWKDLDNTATTLTGGGVAFELFGTDDPHRHFDRLDLVSAAIDELRADDPDWADVTLAVTHAPYQRVLNSFVTNGADVIFAGHTHGGQVAVPGYGALVTNCDIPREQVKGLSLWNHARRVAWLHVSGGLGTSIFAPVRFANRPEATLVTLTAAS
ncbi:metallophosphoesterase [Amnibacterium flavum]|uniref:Metallophosphatase n=1 Tax=Amnibacterium flavum TaxID=2173173 RepID=A0A2V1HX20_9MICO|nr:metallophosphoesterase [Amnibacterium flavum]PVZ95780.1 metallophosphatase [Amnibacterium flavum]